MPPWIEEILDESTWRRRKEAHQEQFASRLEQYVYRRSSGKRDPIFDFLFEYYRFRPAQLLRWSPGFGVGLEAGQEFLEQKGYRQGEAGGVSLCPSEFPAKRVATVRWIASLVAETGARAPSFGCFGMHEWAMVYRTDDIRHEALPLRLSPEEIAGFVDSRPLHCTHFDAWRFFSDAAKPLNRFSLTRELQLEHEQPGCLHANMDLYKWCYKLAPWIGSELLAEAFELALSARTLDMEASPYDLRHRGLEPIAIETAEGRELYQERQRQIWERSQPIRQRLVDQCQRLLDYVA